MLFQCERRALHERAADWSVRTHHHHHNHHMTGRGHDVMHMVRGREWVKKLVAKSSETKKKEVVV